MQELITVTTFHIFYPPPLSLSLPLSLALMQLRDAVGDIVALADKDDHYFLRWLRARKFNVAEAEKMLRNVSKSVDISYS